MDLLLRITRWHGGLGADSRRLTFAFISSFHSRDHLCYGTCGGPHVDAVVRCCGQYPSPIHSEWERAEEAGGHLNGSPRHHGGVENTGRAAVRVR